MPKVVRTDLTEEYDLNNQLIIGRDNTLVNANNLRLWLRLNTSPTNLSNYDSSTISSISYEGTPVINESDQIGRKTYPAALFDNSNNVNGLVEFTGVNNLTTFTNGSQDLPFSISFFYRRNSATASGDTEYFFYKGDPDALNTDEFYCFYNHATQIMFLNLEDEAENQSKYKTVGIQLQNDVWNHIAITVQFGNDADQDIQFYVNGNLITNTLNAVQELNYNSINAVSDTLVVGANRTGNFEADGFFSEFTVWDKTLTSSEVRALYYATIEGWKAKSGFISLPPRVLIKQFDSATGSYPAIARTGDATRKGNYAVRFDDTYTVPFESSFATADIDFGYSLSGGSSSIFPNDFDNIVLTDADGNSATIVFLNSSLIATTDPLPDYPVYYTDKLDRVRIAQRFAAQINNNVGLKLKAKVTKVKKASLGLGIGNRYTSVVVTITQSVPGTLGNQSITRSTQTLTEETATVKNSRGNDVLTFFHYGLTIPSAFTGGKALSVNRTTNLPANALRLQQQAYATPNILETQLDGNGSIFKGVADNNIRFTPGEDLGPFTDSRINLGDSLFYQEGTPSSVYPGFSSPLKSKTQITFDLSPSTSTEFGYKRKLSTTSVTSDISDQGQILMVYWNNIEKRWEEIGQPVTYNNNSSKTGDSLINMVTSSCLGFSPVYQLTTGSTSLVSNGTILPENVIKNYVRPTSKFAFPFGAQYHATSSQYIEAQDLGIQSSFLLEKISLSFDAKFQLPDGTAGSRDAFNFLHSYNSPPNESTKATTSNTKILIPTFFMLRQKPDNFNTKIEFKSIISSFPDYSYNSIIPSNIARNSGSSDLTFVDDSRELITYGQASLIFSQSATSSTNYAIQDLFNLGLGRDLNISASFDVTDSVIQLTGSFKMDFPCRTTPVIPGLSGFDYLIGSSLHSTGLANSSGGRIIGEKSLNISGRGIVNNLGAFTPASSVDISSPDFTSEPVNYTTADIQTIDLTSPYILNPNDKLILGWQFPLSWSHKENAPLSNETVFNTMTLFNNAQITLYGSLVKDNKEFHDTLNQPLTSKAVHESIHHLNPVLDQFEVETPTEYVGTYQDDFFPGKNKNLNPIARLGLAVTSSVSQSLEVGDSYAFQRNVTLFNRASTYFDSYLPSLLSLIKNKAVRYSLPTYSQNNINFPVEFVGVGSNPSTDYTASYDAPSDETSFLSSRNRFIFEDDSSFRRTFRKRNAGTDEPRGFTRDIFYNGVSGFNSFCRSLLAAPYAKDSKRFINQTEDFSIVAGQISKVTYGDQDVDRSGDNKDSASHATGSFPKIIGINGQQFRDVITGRVAFENTSLFYNKSTGTGDRRAISNAMGSADYPTVTSSFSESDFNIPTPRNIPYGMISIIPINQRYVFRGSRYGQFSDLLYSPGNTKFFNSRVGQRNTRKGEQSAAVKVIFVSGSRNTGLSIRKFTKSPPGTQVDLNPLFQSSNLSTACTSSLPFYDDETPRNRSYPSLFV